VPWRATQEFTGACLLEAFGDGFTCFLHEKLGKEEENIALPGPCKGKRRELESNFFLFRIPVANRYNFTSCIEIKDGNTVILLRKIFK